jgi:hypothetical protein
MKPIRQDAVTVPKQLRNSVESIQQSQKELPAIVSISDIHAYHERAQSALLALQDHPGYDPVVIKDDAGQLRWAENNYVLIFNGDLVDRGNKNEAVLRMVSRLAAQAPPGRVRVTLGNHEAIALSADYFWFESWYAGSVGEQDRRALLNAIQDGLVVAAYRGYNFTYAHAGADDSYDVGAVNQQLLTAAEELHNALETDSDVTTQETIIQKYARVLGTGDGMNPKGKGAGLVWLDLQHLSPTAPAQVVGHTKFQTPKKKNNIVCQNVITVNEKKGSPGGETVFVETPSELVAITRMSDGGTTERQY